MTHNPPPINSTPPKNLVRTWLDVIQLEQAEFEEAQMYTKRKIEIIFGSVEIAQMYVDN